MGVAQPGQAGGEGARDAALIVGGLCPQCRSERVAAVRGRPPESLLLRGCWSLNSRPCKLRRRRGEASPGSGVPQAFQTACAPFLGSPRGAALSLPCHSLFISTSAPGDSLRPETSKPPPDGFGGPRLWQSARSVIITWETSKQEWEEEKRKEKGEQRAEEDPKTKPNKAKPEGNWHSLQKC